MAQPIGALRAELSAGHAQFASDMRKAKNAVKTNASGMSKAMHKVGDKFNRAVKAMTSFRGIMTGAAMVTGMIYVIKKNLEYADTIAKTADKVGITTEALQRYRYIADRSGVATDKLDKAFAKFTVGIGDLKAGTGTLYTLLNKNNKALMGQLVAADNTTEALDIYFNTLKDVENQNDRASLAAAAFGVKAGVGMTLMVDNIDTLTKRFKRLGIEIDEKLLRGAEEAKDNIDDLQAVIKVSLTSAISSVSPELGKAAAKMAQWVADNNDFITQNMPAKINALKDSIGGLIELYNRLPAGSVDAGIIGLILAGKYGPLKLAALILTINNVMHKLGRGVQDIAEDSKDASNAMQKMWEAIIGKRDWNTGELKKEFKDVANEAEHAGRVVVKIIKEIAEQNGKGGGKRNDIEDTTEYYKEQAKLWNQVTKDMIVADSVLWDQWTDDQLDAIDKATQARLDYEEQRWEGMKAGYDAEYQLMKDIEDGIKESLGSIANKGEDSFGKLKQTIEGWGRDSADAITKFALTGEMTFSDMVDSMIQDLIRMMIYQKITGPLFGSISGLFGSAKGNAFQGGKVLPFAKGGIVTQPTIFPMAQGAGLMGEAGPEAVLPLKRDAGGNLGVAGGNPIINIYNNVGADVKTSERKTAGGMELDVFIDQAVAKKLGQFGSNSNKAMRQNFGASQRLTGR